MKVLPALLLMPMLFVFVPAWAQSPSDPARPERTYNEIGSSIQRQQKNMQQLQQNQFEFNQLRSQQDRLRSTPQLTEPVAPGR